MPNLNTSGIIALIIAIKISAIIRIEMLVLFLNVIDIAFSNTTKNQVPLLYQVFRHYLFPTVCLILPIFLDIFKEYT